MLVLRLICCAVVKKVVPLRVIEESTVCYANNRGKRQS